MNVNALNPIFYPASIAIVGASKDPTKRGFRSIQKLLVRGTLVDSQRLAAAIARAPDEPGMQPWASQAARVRERAAAVAEAPGVPLSSAASSPPVSDSAAPTEWPDARSEACR